MNVAPEFDNNTPKMVALREGHMDTIKALLEAEAKPEGRGRFGAAMIYATFFGQPRVVEALLVAEAEIDCRRPNGATPLLDAAICNHPEVVKALVIKEANLEAQKNAEDGSATPLIDTSFKGCPNIARILLEAGTNGERKRHNGATALLDTSVCSHLNVKVLLVNGADVEAQMQQRDYGDPPLHQAARNDHVEVVKALLNAKADPNLHSHDGNIALHWPTAAPLDSEHYLQHF